MLEWSIEQTSKMIEMRLAGTRVIVITKYFQQQGFAVTRNAVVGKLWRAGVAGPTKASFIKPKVNGFAQAHINHPIKAKKKDLDLNGYTTTLIAAIVPLASIKAKKPRGVDIMSLRQGVCRWPLWGFQSKAVHKYCGACCDEGNVYCAVHKKQSLVAKKGTEHYGS